ncbi:MAG: adenylate/guanylate cyclase domain-containing protein [Phycisphaerales bacterium]
MSQERRKENKFIVYTDIVGHTKMFGRVGAAFRAMRERHDELFVSAAKQYAPQAVVKGTGDGFYAAMDDVGAAVETALAFRRSLATEDWDKLLPPEKRTPDNYIKARVGIHSGLVNVVYDDLKAIDFDGQPRSITDKVMSMAVGNQVLVTRQVRDQGQVNLSRRDEMEWKKFGEYKLREVVDTVEIWGLGEGELGIGPKPAQPPEHRVIVFATIHDYSSVAEAAGPEYDALKDKWDAAFDGAVAAHAKDTFVKRLPDGSLAAFKNAMDAVRASRDFRRAMKIAMKNEKLQLQPKVALDSGLVTFDYEANRAVDVRDQPVNIAAKVCKTGLSAAWQLILSRPVREDAFQNLPEREEYKWVCIGRKAVPGEPEPVELWDFQDIQSKSETRTVMWVDAKNVHDALRVLPHIYQRFSQRLEDLVREMITRRTEEPWILTTEHGVAAAFKDPVEAVAGAIDLRDVATKEEWERFLTGFSRGSRTDNLIRIAVHQGPMRITFEDGQLKEFKGAAVDGVKPVVEAAKNSQILLSRDLKETVGTAFPASEVKWRRVEITVKDPTLPNEAFELRKVKKIPRPVLIGSAVGAVVVIALLAALVFTRGPSAPKRGEGVFAGQIADTLTNVKRRQGLLGKIGEKYEPLLANLDKKLAVDEKDASKRDPVIAARITTLEQIANNWAKIDETLVQRDLGPKLDEIKDLEGFEAWASTLTKYTRLDEGDNPRKAEAWRVSLERARTALRDAGLTDSDEFKEVAAIQKRVRDLLDETLTDVTKKDITERSAKVTADLDGPSGLVARAEARAAKALADQSDDDKRRAEERKKRVAAAQAKGDFPPETLDALDLAQNSPAASVREMGAAAQRAANGFLEANKGMSAEERGKAIDGMVSLLRTVSSDKKIDLGTLNAEGLPAKFKSANDVAGVTALLGEVDAYRRPDAEDPRQTDQWGASLSLLRRQLSEANDESLAKRLADMGARVAAIVERPWIKKYQEALTKESAAITQELSPAGELSKGISLAVAAAKAKATAGEAALAAKREAIGRFNEAVAPASVGVNSAAVDRAWLASTSALKSARTDENAGNLAVEAGAIFAALKAVPPVFAAAPKIDGTPWQGDLVPVVDRLREEAINEALGKVDLKAVAKPVDIERAAKAGGDTFRQTVEVIERAALDAKSLQDALQAGAGLGQAAAGRKETVQQLAEGLKQSPALAVAGVRSVFAPLLVRYDAFAGVAKASTADELVDAATRPGASDEAISTAWTRLGEIKPTGENSWLGQQRSVFSALQASGVSAAIKDQARAARAGRWVQHVESLGGAGLEAALVSAREQRADFGVEDQQIAKMSWPARYNLALAGIQETLDKDPDESKLKAAVAAVLALEAGAPAGNAIARKTFDLLRGLGAGNVGGGEQALPLDRAGPAAMNDLFDFVPGGGDDAPAYRLKLLPGKSVFDAAVVRAVPLEFKTTGLTFRRVLPKAGETAGKPVYISTTEVSAGMAIELLRRDPGKITTSLFSDTLDGFPRVWSFNDNRRDLRIAAASKKMGAGPLLLAWVTESEKVEDPDKYYPEGLRGSVAPPSPDHPMQYLSVVAAAYVARLAGCRLPTTGEWQAALEAEPGWQNPGQWNLRGPNVDETRAYRKQKRDGPPAWKEEPVFFPGWQRDGCVAVAAPQDRTLWFDKTSDSRAAVFSHLLGNVGEWVFEKPTSMSSVKASEIRAFLDADTVRESAGIIGGSAAACVSLAGAALDEKIAQPTRLAGQQLRNGSERGFADVGFRLAFTPTLVTNEETGVSYKGELAKARAQFAYLGAGGR